MHSIGPLAPLVAMGHSGALECYRQCARFAPRNGRTRMHEAIALASLGSMDEARAGFLRASELAPDCSAAADHPGGR